MFFHNDIKQILNEQVAKSCKHRLYRVAHLVDILKLTLNRFIKERNLIEKYYPS